MNDVEINYLHTPTSLPEETGMCFPYHSHVLSLIAIVFDPVGSEKYRR